MEVVVLSIVLLVVIGVSIYQYRQMHQRQSEQTALEHQLRTDLAVLETQLDQQTTRANRASEEITMLRQALALAEQQVIRLETQYTMEAQALTEAKQRHLNLGQELTDQFKLLANDVLKERSALLDQRSQELLAPLREDLKRFAQQVETTYASEARERYSLQEQIKDLVARSLQLGQEADQLSRALRGEAKVQGNWGEMVLERILEGSGLERGREYVVQEQIQGEDGQRFIPDIVVRYPNGGNIVIDSKVSLTAYTNYVNADTDEDKAQYARLHLKSILSHIDELSRKSYETLVQGSADFVMMFIPNEPAYALAISERPTIWEEAYKRKVILMNATNLIASLRMALDLWQRDRQVQNIESIIDDASKMYDTFVRFTERLLKTEESLEKAYSSFADMKQTLVDGRGNLTKRFEELRKKGLRIKRPLPESIASQFQKED